MSFSVDVFIQVLGLTINLFFALFLLWFRAEIKALMVRLEVFEKDLDYLKRWMDEVRRKVDV